jgi:hypothetical protein
MPKPKVTEDQIRETAYHMWIEDGAPHGKDQDYWYKAVEKLGAPASMKAPAKKTAAKSTAAKKPAAKKASAPKAASAKGKAKG